MKDGQVEISKSLLRKKILDYRRIIEESVWTERNQRLIGTIQRDLKVAEFASVHVFFPIKKNNEPDLNNLLPWFWERSISTVTSKTDFTARKLTHYLIDSKTSLKLNSLSIPEPVNGTEFSIERLDAVFIPLVAADKLGNRIGYGGGFYDQMLKETKAKRIGLCLSPLLDKIVQTDLWDEPLDYIVTPNKLWQKQH